MTYVGTGRVRSTAIHETHTLVHKTHPTKFSPTETPEKNIGTKPPNQSLIDTKLAIFK